MMKKSLVLVSILCLSSWNTILHANVSLNDSERTPTHMTSESSNNAVKSWEFYTTTTDPTPEELYSCSSSNRFGKKASFYYSLFKNAYVTKESVIPGDPMQRTIIRKPDIYNAVRSVEKYFSHSLKKDKATKSEIEDEFCHILKISLAAIDSETTSFEAALNESRKDTQKLLEIFNKVELKKIY